MLWKMTFICSVYWVVKIQYYFSLYNQNASNIDIMAIFVSFGF